MNIKILNRLKPLANLIRADTNSYFAYEVPKADLGDFSAINTADYTLKHQGKDYPVEIGAVLWVRTKEMK